MTEAGSAGQAVIGKEAMGSSFQKGAARRSPKRMARRQTGKNMKASSDRGSDAKTRVGLQTSCENIGVVLKPAP
ncbi:hypothetical protein [Sphingomonas humi]|uniref:Uncharacterized protein n=1 Tax=Sphingomonas humi TaxID=335630 RepID=A0ABP7SFW2_9SPHN